MNLPDETLVPARDRAARNVALDGLRGVAIAMVLWHHLVERYLPPGRGSWLGWLRAGTGLSWTGVDLFFTLSGFFIGGILIDNRASPMLNRVFYARRALRILPLYYATLAAIAVAVLLQAPGSFHLFSGWVYVLFLTNLALAVAKTWDWLPLSVLWSLAVEEQFYLTAPWVARAVPRSRIPLLVAGLVLFSEAVRAGLLLFHPRWQFAMHVLTPFRLDALALGVLVAWAVRDEGAGPFFARLQGAWLGLLAFGGAVLAALDVLQPREGSPLMGYAGYLMIAAVFALVVAIVAKVRPPIVISCLELPPLVHLGRRSYFIYLWHGLLGGVLIEWLGGPDFTLNSAAGLGLVILAVGATWAAAAASWKWFEGPIVALGHRLSY